MRVEYGATLYALLGVNALASPDAIKKAYRATASALHPDRNPNGAEAMARLTVAYATLSDAEARRKYNLTIGLPGDARCAKCGGTGKVYKQAGFLKRTVAECPVCNV